MITPEYNFKQVLIRSFNSFWNGIRVLTDSEVRQEIIDKATGSVRYIGFSKDATANTSDPKWQVRRELVIGKETRTLYSNQGVFDQIWDDRVSLFLGAEFPNSLSTNFDGIDDLLDGGNIFNFDIDTAFSIGMWVKPQNISADRILFSKAGASPYFRGYMIRHEATTGALFMQMRTPAQTRTHTFDTALTAGNWQFVVFTYSGGSNISGASTYRNAVKNTSLPTGTLSGTLLEGQPFQIGSRNSTLYFSGNIDEITVWNKELTPAEVTELYNGGSVFDPSDHSATLNLVSLYRMGDSDVFPIVTDNVNNNDLTMINMASNDFEMDVP